MATEAQVHIVTGKRPEDHISSANAGNFNAGIVGTGSYVLNVGKKLSASLGSNAVTIAEGTAVHNGRQIDVESPVTLTIDAGSAGQKRNDLIVIRYTKDGDGVEDAKLMVIKGTPTTATPTDPSYNKGSILDGVSTSDMPLYRVQLDGVTVKTPIALFVGPIPTVGDMTRKKVEITLSSGCTSAVSEKPFYIRKSGIVSLKGRVKVTAVNAAICDLSDIIDPTEYSSQTNRSCPAVGVTSIGSVPTVVWLDGEGILHATTISDSESRPFTAIDISGLMFLAK